MAAVEDVPAAGSGHEPVGKGSHVYLIDGSGYIFRAFHALPPLTRPSDGLPVGAVHGFAAMLWKLLVETKASEAPTHLAVIFDASEKTFRNDIYSDYKSHRPPAPEELVPQFPLIREAVRAFNTSLRTFPTVIWAKTFFSGTKPMAEFTAAEGAQAPPKVSF